MKGKYVPFLVCLVLVGTFVTGIKAESNENTEITFNFHFDKPMLQNIRIEGEQYTSVIMPSISNGGNPGEPYLPVKPVYVLLPYQAELSYIEVSAENERFAGNGLIQPSPQPYVLGEEPIPPSINESIYSSDEPFPSSIYEKVGIYSFRGYEILIVNLYPVKYIPKSREIYYYEDITLSVHTKSSDKVNELYRGLEKDREEVIKKVDNPKEALSYPLLRGKTTYDLVIITTDAYNISGTNTFQDLKNFKNSNGVPTTIVTVEDIESNPNYWNSTSMFNDTQAQIRNFIKHAYLNWGTDYILLGGDADDSGSNIVPARDLYATAGYYTTYMPSDLYYACLDGNFNNDMDGKWGESNDGPNGGDVDLFAEVYVGRACIDSQDEMENFVSKIISYTQTTDPYLNEVLLVGEYLGFGGVAEWGGNYKDEFVDYSNAHGYFTYGFPSSIYNISKLYDRDWSGNDWPNSELKNIINSNSVHLINHLGHASETYNMKLYNSEVDALTNTEYFFAYSQGCDAGAFDYNDCIAEHFTITEHGAFGGVWNARYGFGASYSTDGPSQRYDREFWDAVYGEQLNTLGMANHDSKEDNAYRINEQCMRWCYYETNLFGDPSLQIRGTETDMELAYDPYVYNFGNVDEGQTYQTTFEIWNAGTGTLTWTLQENYDWLTCNPTSGSSTGEHDTVTVTIDTTGMGGTNTGYVFISSNGGSGAFQVIFYIPSGPILSYTPTSYDFGNIDEGQTYQTTFAISNVGDGILEWQLSDTYPWLTYSPLNGSLSSFEPPDIVTVTIDTTGLTPDFYSGGIDITSNGGDGTFGVTFLIPGPILDYSPSSLDFGDMYEGEQANLQFEIWNTGTDVLTYTLTEYSSWLNVYPTSGSSTGEHDTINVDIDTTSLSEGIHSSNIYISSNGGSGTLTVFVNVIPSTVTYDIDLYEGWNLITLPVENNYTASSLYSDISGCNIILSWNSSSEDFDLYVSGSPYDFTIEEGCGYFVGVGGDTTFSITGMPLENVEVALHEGWNCLGWCDEQPIYASSIYSSIPGCTIVLGWNNSANDFNIYVSGSPYDFIIEIGDGFLVGTTQDGVWYG